MTAGKETRRLSNVSLAPAALATLLAATLLGGAVAGAAITARAEPIDTKPAAIPAATPRADSGATSPEPKAAKSSEPRNRLGGP